MTAFRSMGARKDATRGTLAIEVRKALEALVFREGLLPGAASPLVTGTASFAYQVGKAAWATQREAGDGFHVWGNDGAITLSTADDGSSLVAPATSRIDIVYALHRSNSENGDGDSEAVIAVKKGAASSSPLAPSLPAGALELARNTMTSAATSTASAGNTISQTAPYTAPRGGTIHCRTQGELDVIEALATSSSPILAELGGTLYVCDGGEPRTLGDRLLGVDYLASQTLLAASPSWTDVAEVEATSLGGTCMVQYEVTLFNGASGSDRTATLRLVLDDETMNVGFSGVSVPLTGAPRVARFAATSSTPGAGEHTWKVQASASAATSVYAEAARLTVREG